MSTQPKWSTPIRKACLVRLFLDSGGFCVYGHKDCTIPEHHYEVYVENLIRDWQGEDRELDSLEWQAERQAIHSLGERRYAGQGRFNSIAKDIWHDSQPLFYVEALGMDGLKLQPFAKVKLASTYMRLFVDLGDSLRDVNKNKKRKAIRYGKELPKVVQERIHQIVRLAVRDYLDH